MDEREKHFYFWEVLGSIQVMVGLISFFGSSMFSNKMIPALFIILWVGGLFLMFSGLFISGINSGKRKQLKHDNFINTHTHCPHCAGTGWMKKEK